MFSLEINRYGFFGADTDTSAIHGPIADISKIFKSFFLLHCEKHVFYALYFFKNFKNQDLWAKIFKLLRFQYLINLWA